MTGGNASLAAGGRRPVRRAEAKYRGDGARVSNSAFGVIPHQESEPETRPKLHDYRRFLVILDSGRALPIEPPRESPPSDTHRSDCVLHRGWCSGSSSKPNTTSRPEHS